MRAAECRPPRGVDGHRSVSHLSLIALAFFRPDDVVVIVGPTYSEYARVATLMGAKLIHCDATAETNFEIPSERVVHSLRTLQPRALFLCHTNNPIGQCVPASILRQWAEEFPQTLFIIDLVLSDPRQQCRTGPPHPSRIANPGSRLHILRAATVPAHQSALSIREHRTRRILAANPTGPRT